MARPIAALPALRAFEAVARLGSVRAAAEELHVTPGAVSQQVKALEAELGVTLIRRTGTGTALTQVGAVAVGDLTQAFRLLAQATAKMRKGKRGLAIRLRIDDPAIAVNWLIARLQHYRALPDSVDIVLETATAWRSWDEDDDSYDMAIRFSLGEFPGQISHRLFSDEVFPVCSPELLRETPLHEPADLAHCTLLHLDWSSAHNLPWPDWPAWLRAAGVSGIDASRGPRFNDFTLCLQSAVAGQGVALGTKPVVADHLAAGTLVAPFAKRIVTPFAYYLVYAPTIRERPEAQGFIDWILEEARQTAG
ncbi:MAG TPA: LysR substrate-binding domain-containing protein [Dongiaceae bacterium]|nr:LysR substrate-binding domain-containing protein [Dongiaceae bacterium]